MKKRNNIYRRLLAPFLACLVLALAGCSKDETEAETPSSSPGGTYLTIVTRGINTTDATQYEDYVGKLRIIAFDTDGNAVDGMNFTIDRMSQFKVLGSGDDAYIEVTKEFDGGTITSGIYTFYFVANEDDYNTIESQTLSAALDAVTDESELKGIQVETSMTISGQIKPSAINMLMSTGSYTALIREGENNRIGDNNHIELIRAFAKAQLALKLPEGSTSQDVPTVTSVTLNGSYPAGFYLIPGNTVEITPSVTLTNRAIEENGTSLFDEKLSLYPKPFYISQTVYLPECSYNANNAWAYHITIDEQTYTNAVIADGENPDAFYDITRNYAYTTIGTYRQNFELDFNLLVVPWDDKVIEVPPFE